MPGYFTDNNSSGQFIINSIILSVITIVLCYKFFLGNYLPLPLETIYPSFDLQPTRTPHDVGNLLVSDSILQIFAWKNLVVENIASGFIPFINPYIFAGNYLLANGQSGVFYFGNLPLIFFGMITGWKILFFLQFLLAAIFMYLYLRNLLISSESALFGGVVYGFSGFMLAWSSWTIIGHTILWYPLLLFSIDKWLLRNKPQWIGLGVACIINMVFAGHLQFAFYGIILGLMYSLYRLIAHEYYLEKLKVIGIALIFFAGLSVASIQLLPTASAVMKSPRFENLNRDRTEVMLPWKYILGIFIPSFFGWPNDNTYFGDSNFNESVGYVGFVTLLLLFYAIWGHRKRVFYFYVFLLLFSLLLSFKNPITLAISTIHAGIFGTGLSGRMLLVFTFSASVLASSNLDNLMQDLRKGKFLKFVSLLIFFCTFYIAIKLLAYFRHILFPGSKKIFELDFLNTEINFYLLVIIIISLVFLLTYHIRRLVNIIPLVLTLLLVFDLLKLGYKIIPWADASNITNTPAPYRTLQGTNPHERVVGDSIDDSGNLYNIAVFNGYDPISPASYRKFIDENCNNQDLLPTSRVRLDWMKCFDKLKVAGLRYVVDRDGSKLKENPRLFETEMHQVFKGQKITIYEIKNHKLPAEFVHLESGIKNFHISGNQIEFNTNISQTDQLKIYFNYLDGWKGYMDNTKIKVDMTSDGFITLNIPPGAHTYKLEYFPEIFILGFIISSVSLVFLGLTTLAISLSNPVSIKKHHG